MNVYLTIMVTVLVATQIIRVTQNAIQIKKLNQDVKDNIKWIQDVELTKEDVLNQKRVYELARYYLEEAYEQDQKRRYEEGGLK